MFRGMFRRFCFRWWGINSKRFRGKKYWTFWDSFRNLYGLELNSDGFVLNPKVSVFFRRNLFCCGEPKKKFCEKDSTVEQSAEPAKDSVEFFILFLNFRHLWMLLYFCETFWIVQQTSFIFSEYLISVTIVFQKNYRNTKQSVDQLPWCN